MPLPHHEEDAEARLAAIVGRKDQDLQHLALLGPKVADHAWEDSVYRALRQLEIYDTHEDKTPELELALYLTIQGELRQVGNQFITKYDLWAVMDEARRRNGGELPRGPPGKKRARYPGEKEPKNLYVRNPRMAAPMLKVVEVKEYYSNPAIPRWTDDE